jgi:hypothetical protein
MVGNSHAVVEIKTDFTEIHMANLAEAGTSHDHQNIIT